MGERNGCVLQSCALLLCVWCRIAAFVSAYVSVAAFVSVFMRIVRVPRLSSLGWCVCLSPSLVTKVLNWRWRLGILNFATCNITPNCSLERQITTHSHNHTES